MFKGEIAFEIKLLTLGKFIFQCFDVVKGEKAFEIKLFTLGKFISFYLRVRASINVNWN